MLKYLPEFCVVYSQAESAHIEGAKDPWKHVNHQPDTRDKQMVCLQHHHSPLVPLCHLATPLHPTVFSACCSSLLFLFQAAWVGVRDTCRMLRDAVLQLREQRMEQAQQQQPPHPQQQVPITKMNSLFAGRPVVKLHIREVSHQHAALSQLDFAIRVYLRLAQGDSHLCNHRDMQQLDSTELDIRPGTLTLA